MEEKILHQTVVHKSSNDDQDFQSLSNKLFSYQEGETERHWKMDDYSYSNSYISVVRIDTSNNHSSPTTMEKVWSIIFERKKDFYQLNNWKKLCQLYNIQVTPVQKGKNKGCYGIRIRGMKKDPDNDIIQDILNFIFS